MRLAFFAQNLPFSAMFAFAVQIFWLLRCSQLVHFWFVYSGCKYCVCCGTRHLQHCIEYQCK